MKTLLYKLRYLIAFLIFLLAITFLGDSSLINRFGQKMEISRLQNEIDDLNRHFAADKEQLQLLKSDPEAVRSVARSRYYMKTADEDVFVIEDE